MLKKLIVITIVLCLAVSLFACAGGDTTTTTTAQGGSELEGADAYEGKDLEEAVEVLWYALGDVPEDMDRVLEEVNGTYLQPVLNATLGVRFLAWSEYATKYSLVLAGGEDCDMIYTASWCFFQQEAQKGAFIELTDEFLQENMPLTLESQAEASWEQVSLDGKTYAVTRNYLSLPNYKFMAIRDDLRTKYDLPEVTDLESFQEYMFTIAENEPAMQALASPGNNRELSDILLLQNNKLYSINANSYNYVWKDTDDLASPPQPEDVMYLYSTQEYRDFANLMREWADKGVWSKNAISSSVSTADAYAQGLSAALPWVDAVFGYGKQLEEAELGEAAYVDITNHIVPRVTVYSGDAMAITRTSKNPERTGMVLDFLKNNKDLNLLIYGGIEDVHFVINDDGTRSKGPEAEKFGWGAIAWALQTDYLPKEANRDPRELAIVDSLRDREKPVPIDGFNFDETSVKAEVAVLASLIEEYSPSFELGVYGDDTETKLDEFFAKQESAGLEKVMTEYRAQYAEYLESKGLTP